MIRKLLYRFRRMVLVWRLDWLVHRLKRVSPLRAYDSPIWDEIDVASDELVRLDAAEISKGEAYVIVR